MIITNSNDKDVKCYMAFVDDPTNPKKMRAFCKRFEAAWAKEAAQLHKRLVASSDADQYNRMYGQPKNCIETMQGTKDKDPKIFKVRVGLGPRKFFHHVKNEQGDLLLTKEWIGEFKEITHIHVIAINNHDYKAV
jgi:hypothetical protein